MLKKSVNPQFFNPSWIVVFFLLHLAFNGFSQSSNIVFPGANEKTPARSQFFSWINNTNEGTTEKQTLSNLDFFQYLRDGFVSEFRLLMIPSSNLVKKKSVPGVDFTNVLLEEFTCSDCKAQ